MDGKHIAGKPRYARGDSVRFLWNGGEEKQGVVEIVDEWGTFEQSEEPSYDILLTAEDDEQWLYKHVRESWIIED